MKAMTNIVINNQLFRLPNELIVKYLSATLGLSDKISSNPYFIYKLFSLFSIDEDAIESIKVYDGFIIVKTSYYEYEIVINSNSGLTTIINDISNDYNNIYFNLRRIVEIMPTDSGMTIYNHKDVVMGSLIDFNCQTTRSLKITNVDESGIATSVEHIAIERKIPGGLFNRRSSIEPCRIEEYEKLKESYKRVEGSSYKHISRCSIKCININEQKGVEKFDKIRDFASDDVLEIIDLKETNYNSNGYSNEELKTKLRGLETSNKIEANLANEVGRRLGILLNKNCADNISIKNQRLVKDVLTPSKEYIRRSNV